MENIKRNVMHAIKMERINLLKIVRENKEKHIMEFNESVEDYKKLILQFLSANVKIARTANMDEFKKLKTYPSAPISYEDSYKRAIRMLELSIEDNIEIEEDVFNQLVLDEWSWKRSFTMTGSLYKSAI